MTRKTSPWAPAQPGGARVSYSPDLLGSMQRLLAALADLEHAYDSDLDGLRASNAPEMIKHRVMQTLEQQHQERRAPLVGELEALQRRAMIRDQGPRA